MGVSQKKVVQELFLAIVLVALAVGSVFWLRDQRSLMTAKRSGELVIHTLNSPTTTYIWKDGKRHGPEFDLASAFAESLSLKPRFVVHKNVGEVLNAVKANPASVGAAGLTQTPERRKQFLFGPVYQTLHEQLVCRRGKGRPRSLATISGHEVWLTGKSSYENTLHDLPSHQAIQWTVKDSLSTEQILQSVWKRGNICAMADSTIVKLNQRLLPELRVVHEFPSEKSLAWIFSPQAFGLRRAASDWLSEFKGSGQLAIVLNRYYGFAKEFDYTDVKVFRRRMKSRLPAYLPFFREAAKKHRIDWEFLAAMSYQESHWNPQAVSATGVQGLMMLTRPTAASLGVEDRTDPRQSIFGGAKYFRRLFRRWPEEVTNRDRHWLTLAAYNLGWGHVQDALRLAESLGREPYLWSELRGVLPLLSDPDYYSRLDYGYARGMEPVLYVQRVRHYRDLLERAYSPKTERITP